MQVGEEESEYRIYISSAGGAPVVRDIIGDEELTRRIAEVRALYPTDTIYVREVFETVKFIVTPAYAVDDALSHETPAAARQRPNARVIPIKKRRRNGG